ncbi:SdpA family antimicrobial peptide system protein [Chryseobacterium sp. MEBOG06]|uniref:SdpA family antimicrobial peptide system protein n=1 Tax=Chryseobacterium sp. MEBOG06 TaxID=2879938 RepID=UPI001F44AF4F|nr:SdpA family antimicrobial peptide system protein [Chryseobacterium sp. MEBOG06]UKB82303.1 SdpA family antimicrobial peptide system protein [Chryseobacterium sp. MEBOG06]
MLDQMQKLGAKQKGFFFVCIFIFKISSVYFGNSPLNKSKETKKKYISFFPQGWAFFTKEPRDPLIYLFSFSNNKFDNVIDKNFSLNTFLGASRKSRIINVELQKIVNKIITDSIEYRSEEFLGINELKKNVINRNNNFTKVYIDKKYIPDINNGKYLIVIEEPLPWALLSKTSNYKAKFKIYPIQVVKN